MTFIIDLYFFSKHSLKTERFYATASLTTIKMIPFFLYIYKKINYNDNYLKLNDKNNLIQHASNLKPQFKTFNACITQ